MWRPMIVNMPATISAVWIPQQSGDCLQLSLYHVTYRSLCDGTYLDIYWFGTTSSWQLHDAAILSSARTHLIKVMLHPIQSLPQTQFLHRLSKSNQILALLKHDCHLRTLFHQIPGMQQQDVLRPLSAIASSRDWISSDWFNFSRLWIQWICNHPIRKFQHLDRRRVTFEIASARALAAASAWAFAASLAVSFWSVQCHR